MKIIRLAEIKEEEQGLFHILNDYAKYEHVIKDYQKRIKGIKETLKERGIGNVIFLSDDMSLKFEIKNYKQKKKEFNEKLFFEKLKELGLNNKQIVEIENAYKQSEEQKSIDCTRMNIQKKFLP